MVAVAVVAVEVVAVVAVVEVVAVFANVVKCVNDCIACLTMFKLSNDCFCSLLNILYLARRPWVTFANCSSS